MSRAVVLPHRTATRGIHVSPWTTFMNGQPIASSLKAPAWDHDAPIELRSEVRIDPDIVRDQCGLGADDPVELVTTWTCPATRTRAVGARTMIDGAESRVIEVLVEPQLIDSRLQVTRAVVLAATRSSRDPAVARRRGSVLWREHPRESFTLELGPPTRQFVTEVIDFDHVPGVESGAAWEVQIRLDDLDAASSAAMQLLVNARHSAIASLLDDEQDSASSTVRSVLRWDVVRSLITGALENDDFVNGTVTWPPDTVGGVLQALFDRWFPDFALDELARMRVDGWGHLESMLQARLRFLDEQ